MSVKETLKDSCYNQNEDKTSHEEFTKRKSSKYPKFEDPKLDPQWLYSILRKEITKESSYNLENDAKIRAVSQGTVNYEQFRQMVLGAHIRPLEKKDKVEGYQNGKKPYVVWNTMAKKCADNKEPRHNSEGPSEETLLQSDTIFTSTSTTNLDSKPTKN